MHIAHGQTREVSPLELELWAVVSHPGWVLGTKLRSSGGAGNTPDCSAAFPAFPRILKYRVSWWASWSRPIIPAPPRPVRVTWDTLHLEVSLDVLVQPCPKIN